MVKQALQGNPLEQVGFLMGRFPDHLYDLARLIWKGSAADNLVRYGTLAEFEGQATLALASQRLFGEQRVPTFDIENAEMLFSFGANFVETWISPVAYAFGYGEMRQGHTGQRGYLVQFEPRMSQTAANADEWYPITPGSERLLAQALSRLVAEIKTGSAPPALTGGYCPGGGWNGRLGARYSPPGGPVCRFTPAFGSPWRDCPGTQRRISSSRSHPGA